MSTHPASPADVFDEAPFAKVLQSAKCRVIAALDLAVLNEWMDNGSGRNPKYPRY